MARPLRDAAILTLLCAIASGFGLVDHGLTNWQESIRVVAAREMQASGDWVVPTVQGKPYLAKPPAIYWAQLTLATLTGRAVSIVDLRLTVALAGWLGVLATWWATRRLLRDPPAQPRPSWIARRLLPTSTARANTQCTPTDLGAEVDRAVSPDRVAFWAGAMLATGILAVRSSRIGELDILLVAPTALAILAAVESVRTSQARSWLWTLVFCLACAVCSLVKGPPALLAPIATIFGWSVFRAAGPGMRDPARRPVVVGAGVVAALASAGVLPIVRTIGSFNDVLGLVFFALAFGGLASTLVAVASVRAAVSLVRDACRSRWPIALGAGFASLWAWGAMVAARAGDRVVSRYAEGEAADNLHLLELSAPARGLEWFAYAAGLGSVCALIAVVWIVLARGPAGRRLRELPAGFAVLVAWLVVPFVLFNMLGRGTHRYLTPVTPAVAAFGAVFLVLWFRYRQPVLGPRLAGVVVASLAIGQGAWYGHLRDERLASRSPRDFVAALRSTDAEGHIADGQVGSFEIWTPAFDYYAGAPVVPYFDRDTTFDFPHAVDRIEILRDRLVRTGGSFVLFVRAEPPPDRPEIAPARERLRELGFEVEPIRVELDEGAIFRVDKYRTPIEAVIVRAAR